MRPYTRFACLLATLLGLGPLATVQAQADGSAGGSTGPFAQGVVTVSGDSVDRLRLAQLLGLAPLEGLMLRSTGTLTDPRRNGLRPRAFTIVLPEVTYINNTSLPFGQNDGALWAGVGANVRALGGFTATAGPLRLVAIPEFVYSANNRLSMNPGDLHFAPPNARRYASPYSSPWNVVPYSIDLPWRFGPDPIKKLYPGQSSLTLTAGPIEVGGATENEWWGPALRNPVVMGDNAAGFPHAFLRTSHPLGTRFGRFDGRWIIGGLHESKYFDSTIADNVRSLSAIAITWTPTATSGLALGFTRSVFSVTDGYSNVAGHFLDAFKNVGHPDGQSIGDTTMTPGSDQLFSLFARYALPAYGLETYVEWGRADFPVSMKDFLAEPNHSRGYTAGLQWARSVGSHSRVRFQSEVTNVEQSSSLWFRGVGSFYTSRSVIQGYTNEGQLIAAGIGPGSSAQWLAGDYFPGNWQVGLTMGRTRFNNDAFYLLPYETSFANSCGHDVTTYPGLRLSYSGNYFRLRTEYKVAHRYNSYFHNKTACNGSFGTDRVIKNLSVTLTLLGW
jgi:Capsule assembly protein Wzi